jgi:hypothetical protein
MKLFQLLVASGLVISAAMVYAQPPPQPNPPVQVAPGDPTTGRVLPGTPGTLPGGFGNVSAPVSPPTSGTGTSSGSITGPTFVPAGRNLNPPPPGSVPPAGAPGVNPGSTAPGPK